METTWGKLCPGGSCLEEVPDLGRLGIPSLTRSCTSLLPGHAPKGPWKLSLLAAVMGRAPIWALGWDLRFSCF